MNDLVYVVMTTYKRTELAAQTLQALKKNLKYPHLAWHIADDGSGKDHIDTLVNIVGSATITDAQRGGVGKSKNLALTVAFRQTPYVFLLEDDWELIIPLDLEPHVKLLRDVPTAGMVRFGFLGGHMEAEYDDWNGPFTPYWKLKPGSGMYVYSGQVSLRHKRFYDALGLHKEGIAAGEEEEELCWRYNQIKNPPDIFWSGHYACTIWNSPFQNIGLGEKSLNAVKPESS